MDNKSKRGIQDRVRVAGLEPYEVRYIAEKFGVAQTLVRNAIKAVGNNRKLVYRYIEAAIKDKGRIIKKRGKHAQR